MADPVVLSEGELLTDKGERITPAAFASIADNTAPVASIPASASNAGEFLFDPDTGTLYHSNGSSWVQWAASVSADAEWSPADMTGGFFLLADDIALADGASVTTWVDQVDGLNFSQATADKKPVVYNTPAANTTINGEPAVAFDGVDDILVCELDQGFDDDAGTLWVLVSSVAWDAASSTFVASCDSGASATDTMWSCGHDASKDPRIQVRNNGTQLHEATAGSSTLVDGSTYLLEYRSTGDKYRMRRNNARATVSLGAGTVAGKWLEHAARDNFSIGGRKGTSEILNAAARFGFVRYVPTFTDMERANLIAWAVGKYGTITL